MADDRPEKDASEAKASEKKVNRFRLAEKRYRLYKGKEKRRRLTDFSDVLDLRGEEGKDPRAVLVGYGGTVQDKQDKEASTDDDLDSKRKNDAKQQQAATTPTSSSETGRSRIWKIPQVEGLYVITNGLSIAQQAHWARIAVEKFSLCEHTNLTNLYGEQPDHWREAVKRGEVGRNSGFFKLRWASLGYHYDWTNRLYYKNLKSDFPSELASLASSLADQVSMEVRSEAAIVNFYPHDASMGGHVDDAEFALNNPIVSVSLGCTAVFLIGSENRETDPLPIFLRSGDVVIMGGKSRICFHGVPRIIKGTCADLGEYLKSQSSEGEQLLGKYLESSRINMNIRQVEDAQNTFDVAKKQAYPRPSAAKS